MILLDVAIVVADAEPNELSFNTADPVTCVLSTGLVYCLFVKVCVLDAVMISLLTTGLVAII